MPMNDKFLKALGKNIDKHRKAKGISFQEMAYRCDIEKSNLVKMTTKGENITANTLYKISQGLEVPLKIIFDFKY
jgi:transcriptional regulator with XRE-family HTH domain